MKYLKKFFFIIMIMALVAVPVVFNAKPASADPVYTCLPTCEVDDGRFFSVAGTGMNTLTDETIQFNIVVPPDATSVEIGIFDGNTAGMWDGGNAPVNLEYLLYADPLMIGAESILIAQLLGETMPDNDWFNATVIFADMPNAEQAQSPSGYYSFHLHVRPSETGVYYLSNFKVRTDGVVSLLPEPFSYMGVIATFQDAQVIYPLYPDLTETKYNGEFHFYPYLATSQSSFAIWDGDLDFGSFDLADLDTDDPDTPNDGIPLWAIGSSAVPEGVAIGDGGSTGSPRDDNSSGLLRRTPSVTYFVAPPNQTRFDNTDPSGNLEWEQFRIEMDESIPADYYVSERLPAGLYHVHNDGMDLGNLNAWRFSYKVVGVCEFDPETGESNPCKNLPHPYKIGDTVFKDRNGDGIQDADEPGRAGVVLYLLDGNGAPILDIANNPISTVTDATGYYEFDVEGRTVDPYTNAVTADGEYTVQVGAENFLAGGALAGLVSTTGGDSQTNTVIDSNVMDYDFGYGLTATTLGVASFAYWADNPDAWPSDDIEIGGITYSKEAAISLMLTVPGQDWTYKLFRELVAAKLNVAIGNESICIDASIIDADAWMAAFPVGSNVKYKSEEWNAIKGTYYQLRNYNLGLLCAPPM